MKAEEIIIEKISTAFPLDSYPTEKWIEANPYLFEKLSAMEAISYISVFMIYVLKMIRVAPSSMVHMQLLYTINEYSKCKDPKNPHLGFWFLLTSQQQNAILAFLNHLLHNQPANIDDKELAKIIKRWQKLPESK